MLYYLSMYRVFWYTNSNGNSPVQETVNTLSIDDRAKVYAQIELLRVYGPCLTEPYVKTIRSKLKELRLRIKQGQYRILFFIYTEGSIYLLHSFVKKTQKTPEQDISIAVKRMKEISK